MTKTTTPLRIAVITGGHPFDVPTFHKLFRGHEDIDAYVQDFENFVHDWGQVRTVYDALVFYNMHMDKPDGPFLSALDELGQTSQGVFVLHHALLAWPQVESFGNLVGVGDRSFGYHMGQTIRVDIADPTHPITAGLQSWEMGDETYTMADAGADSRVLMTVDHPKSMRTVAWTRMHGAARVFCFQCGHDRLAWEHPTFREVVARGIRWCSGRL